MKIIMLEKLICFAKNSSWNLTMQDILDSLETSLDSIDFGRA